MAIPQITYERSVVQDPDWRTVRTVGSPNALIVPDAFLKARQKEAIEKAKQDRGKLFTEWVGRSRIGLNPNVVERSTKRVSHQLLQNIARQSPIDQGFISSIISTMSQFCQPQIPEDLEMGFEVVHVRDNDPNFTPTKEEQERFDRECRQMEKLIMAVNKEVEQSFSYFLSAWIDDELTIDRKVMVKILDNQKRPIAYHWLPGATIVPTLKFIRPFMEEWGAKDSSMWNPTRAAERLSLRMYKEGKRDMYGNVIDLSSAKYVQIYQDEGHGDQILAAWKEDEIFVDIVRPYAAMNESLYGFSPLEQSLPVSLLWMRAWNYQTQLFDVTWPEAMLILYGDYDQEGLNTFQQTMLADNGNLMRLPIIAAGSQADGVQAQMFQLRKTPTEMLFSELLQFLTNLKASSYGIRPISINMPSQNIDPTSQKQEMNFSLPEINDPGVRGRMRRSAKIFTEQIIQPWYPYLKMRWVGQDLIPEDQRIQRELGLAAIKTVDEIRGTLGLAKLPPGVPGDNLGDWILNPNAITAIGNILAQKAQQQAGTPQNPSELSHPEGSGTGGDFGQGNDMPDAQKGIEPQQAAQPEQGAQPVPPVQGQEPMQPMEPEGK